MDDSVTALAMKDALSKAVAKFVAFDQAACG
jgi:hypothetical protein